MSPSGTRVAAWALALTAILGGPMAMPVSGQQPNPDGVVVPKLPPPPGSQSRLSPYTITNELNQGVEKLRQALELQTNGSTRTPEEIGKVIYDGYAKVRMAHALLTRRISHVTEKTKSPDPMLDLAFSTIRKARFQVLHARQATLKSDTARSVQLLTSAIPELERASALIQ